MRVTNRLSPILIGMLVSGRNGENFDSAPFLQACPSQEVDRSPAAAAVSSRAGVRQFGRPRRASDRADPPPGLRRTQTEAQAAPCEVMTLTPSVRAISLCSFP